MRSGPREAGPNLAASELEVHLLIFLYQPPRGSVSFIFCSCCGDAVNAHALLSTGLCRPAFAPDGHRSTVESRSMYTLSIQRPGPSIDMRTPDLISTPVTSAPVNRLPGPGIARQPVFLGAIWRRDSEPN